MGQVFSVKLDEIHALIDSIDPVTYARTRNHINGSVTRLSPFISRGVISTSEVWHRLIRKGWTFSQGEKLFQELAWRDFWQSIWRQAGNRIDKDYTVTQSPVLNHGVPSSILNAQTGIEGVDAGLRELNATGYMHNHQRMYVASIACNFSLSHWLQPARWMYYHLIDGDWASNALSWQWVAGSFNNRKYFVNQENIDKYCNTRQSGTFLDVSYDRFPLSTIPSVLKETLIPNLFTALPEVEPLSMDLRLPVVVYTSYNLDPRWRKDFRANRILLLEPSHFRNYPVSDLVLRFILDLAAEIPELQVFVGEFSELKTLFQGCLLYYKEHPFAEHFDGIRDERQWLSADVSAKGSFFKYWKQVSERLVNHV